MENVIAKEEELSPVTRVQDNRFHHLHQYQASLLDPWKGSMKWAHLHFLSRLQRIPLFLGVKLVIASLFGILSNFLLCFCLSFSSITNFLALFVAEFLYKFEI